MLVVGTSSTFITRVLIGACRAAAARPTRPCGPLDQIAVGEASPETSRCSADIADDHADIADRDLGQRDRLDLHEPGVQVPGAREQHFFLETAAAARVDEGLAALEAVVARPTGPGQIARGDRAAVENGDDPDAIRGHVVHVQRPRLHAEVSRVSSAVTTSKSGGLIR